MKLDKIAILGFLITLTAMVSSSCETDSGFEVNSFVNMSPFNMSDHSVLVYASQTWEWKNETQYDDHNRAYDFKGKYTFENNIAIMDVTHYQYHNGGWIEWDDKWHAIIYEKHLTVYFYEYIEQNIKQLADTRFYGVFTSTKDYTSMRVRYDDKLTFDGTNKFQYYSQKVRNGIPESPYETTYEMEVNDGKFRRKLWGNPYDTWTEWLNYEFDQSGNKLLIQWYDSYEKKESYDVYDKIDTAMIINNNKIAFDIQDVEIYNLIKQMETNHKLEYKKKRQTIGF